jgi:hypothetical protein
LDRVARPGDSGKRDRENGPQEGRELMTTKQERIAWEMFRTCLTHTLGEEAAADPAVQGHWFRFLEETGKDKARLLALAIDPEDIKGTMRPLWDAMWGWCIMQVVEQVIEENSDKHVTVYNVGQDGKPRRAFMQRKANRK